MSYPNPVCISGGPKNAQEAYQKLAERLNGAEQVNYNGFNIVKNNSAFGDTITVYLSHDQGVDRIFRVQREWHFRSATTYSFQKTVGNKTPVEWKDVSLESYLCTSEETFSELELIWYSLIFALGFPK